MAAVPVYLSILFAIACASVIVQGVNTTLLEISMVTAPLRVTVEKRTPLLLNCSVVTSRTFGPLQFRWRKNGLPLDSPLLDRRVQIFQNGSLYFRRIVHRKRRDDQSSDEGLYECVAGNSNGFVVARRVQVEVSGIARNFTEEPTPAIAYVDGTARFFCSIRANPPAIILWQKDKAQLTIDDQRFVRLPSGALQIHNVTQSDSGSYWCMAAQNIHRLTDSNFKCKNSRQATLTVLQASSHAVRVLAAPQNTTAMAGETVVLECLADGDPFPTIEWRRQDKKLTDRHQIFGGANLRIVDVRPEDAGMYQCFVRRGNYKLHHSAILSIHTYPVMTRYPASNDWPMARTVTLLCEVNGYPKPTVHWYFNGTPIDISLKDKIRYVLADDNMILYLYTMKQENGGYYQCIAENSIGQVSAIARINIQVHKDAPPQPQNVTLTPINSTTLRVDWVQEETSKPILTFVVSFRLKDTQRSVESQEIVEASRRSCYLMNLEPYTSYVVTIRSFTSLGSSLESRSVEQRTLEGVPRRVPSFQISSPSAETMQVIWDELEPRYRGGVIIKYRLKYRPASNPSAIVTHIIDDPTLRSFLVKGLTPDTSYEVQLAAATVHGYPAVLGGWSHHTTPSADSVGMSTPQLKVAVLNASSVLLHWELSGISTAVGDHYHIHAIDLRCLGVDCIAVSIPVDPPQTSYILTGLENNTDYEVTVYASQKLIQVTHTFRISEGQLVPPASQLRSRAINPNTVRLEWSPSVYDKGIIKYQVCYKETSSPAPLVAHCMDSEKPFAVITNLKPFTKFKFGVRTFGEGDMQGSFTMLETTTSEDKPGPPVNLTYKVFKPGSVRLQWKPPTQPNGIITFYVVFYHLDSSVPDNLWKNLTRSGPLTEANISDLDMKQYFFKVVAFTKAGRGTPSKVIVVFPDCGGQAQCGIVGRADDQSKQEAIIIGICIGLAFMIICIVIIVCRHRCCRINHGSPPCANHHGNSVPAIHGNRHLPSGHGNGHAHAPLPGDPPVGVELMETVPMLTRLPENEMSDSKGGGDMIVTPNGVRINGLVKTNGHLPNGLVTSGHLDLSATSEETRSLIEAMLAATNGNAQPHHHLYHSHNHRQPYQQHPWGDLPLIPRSVDSNLDSEGDSSLTAIDHWDKGSSNGMGTGGGGGTGGEEEDDSKDVIGDDSANQGSPTSTTTTTTSSATMADSRGDLVLAGNVVMGTGNGSLSSTGVVAPTPHFAPFPQRMKAGEGAKTDGEDRKRKEEPRRGSSPFRDKAEPSGEGPAENGEGEGRRGVVMCDSGKLGQEQKPASPAVSGGTHNAWDGDGGGADGGGGREEEGELGVGRNNPNSNNNNSSSSGSNCVSSSAVQCPPSHNNSTTTINPHHHHHHPHHQANGPVSVLSSSPYLTTNNNSKPSSPSSHHHHQQQHQPLRKPATSSLTSPQSSSSSSSPRQPATSQFRSSPGHSYLASTSYSSSLPLPPPPPPPPPPSPPPSPPPPTTTTQNCGGGVEGAGSEERGHRGRGRSSSGSVGGHAEGVARVGGAREDGGGGGGGGDSRREGGVTFAPQPSLPQSSSSPSSSWRHQAAAAAESLMTTTTTTAAAASAAQSGGGEVEEGGEKRRGVKEEEGGLLPPASSPSATSGGTTVTAATTSTTAPFSSSSSSSAARPFRHSHPQC